MIREFARRRNGQKPPVFKRLRKVEQFTGADGTRKQLLVFKGKEWDRQNHTLKEGEVKVEYHEHQPKETAEGRVITREAAQMMIDEYYWKKIGKSSAKKRKKKLKKPVAVTFNRGLLTFLLSQKDCEGIRCYFCRKPKEDNPKKKETTLVLVGIDKEGNDLNTISEYGGIGTIALGKNQPAPPQYPMNGYGKIPEELFDPEEMLSSGFRSNGGYPSHANALRSAAGEGPGSKYEGEDTLIIEVGGHDCISDFCSDNANEARASAMMMPTSFYREAITEHFEKDLRMFRKSR